MEHFVKIIEAIAWPISVITISVIFRNEVRLLMGRMSKVKFSEFQAEFDKNLTKAEKEAQEIPAPVKESSLAKSNQINNSINRLNRIAEVSGRAAITEAWTELESVISQFVSDNKIEPRKSGNRGGSIPLYRILEEITNNGYMPSELLPLYKDLRDLRNKVAHQYNFDIEFAQAERYIHLVHHFMEKMRAFNPNEYLESKQDESKLS